MAVRNISVQISANVRKYTDGLRTAETATRKFQSTVQSTGKVQQSAARLHTLNEKALLGVARGTGNALTRENNYSAALRRTEKAMRATSQATTGYSKALAFVKSAATSSLAALGGFTLINGIINGTRRMFSFLVDSVVEFDAALTKSLAISEGATARTRELMAERARLESTKSVFSPAEVAEGMYYLVAAGLDAQQSMEAVGIAASFAQAGVMEFEKGAEMLVQTQAALGMRTDDATKNMLNMTRVADVLVMAANRSTTTVELLGEAMQNKFATALSLANRTVEEGAAILQVYAQRGIQGRLAGTQASMFLRDIQKAAINNKEAFREMNIEVYDSQGNLQNLTEIGRQMNAAFGNMSSEELRTTLKDLGFADRAVHAILPIISANADEWDRLDREMSTAGGTAARVSAKQLKSLENRMKLLIQAISIFAEKVGRGALDLLYKAWDRLRDPVNEFAANLVTLRDHIWPVVEAAATIAGAAVVGGLVAVAEALALAAKAANSLRFVLGPVLAMVLGFQAIKWAGSGIARFVGMMGTGFAGVKNNIAGTRQQLQALNQGVQQQGMHATRTLTAWQQIRLVARGTFGEFIQGWQQSRHAGGSFFQHVASGFITSRQQGYGMFSSMRAGWAQARSNTTSYFASARAGLASMRQGFATVRVAAMNAAAGVSIIGGAILMAVQQFKQMQDERVQRGQDQAKGITDQFNLGNLSDISKARRRLQEEKRLNAERSRIAQEDYNSRWNIAHPLMRKMIRDEEKTRNEQLTKEEEALNKREANIRNAGTRIARAMGVSTTAALERIESMGLGEVLGESIDNEEYATAVASVKQSFEGIADAAGGAGLSVDQMARMSQEELEELTAEADAVAEALAEAFAPMVDPAEIMSGIREIKEEIYRSFGQDVPGILGDMNSELEEAAQKAGDAAFESYEASFDAEIKRLEEARDALDKPKQKRGKKSDAYYAQYDAATEQYTAEKEAIDAQIDSLREGKREREDFNRAAGTVTASSFLERLKAEGDAAEDYYNKLDTIKEQLKASGLTPSEQEQVLAGLASLGQEGLPIIEEFASASETRFREMANVMVEQMQRLEPEITVTMDDYIAKQQEATKKLDQLGSQMAILSGKLFDSVTPDEIAKFVALGPEAAAMIPEMVMRAQSADGAATVASTIKTALMNADFGEGNIPAAIRKGMEQAAAVASGDENRIRQAFIEGMNPTAMIDEMQSLGMMSGASLLNGMLDELRNSTLWPEIQRRLYGEQALDAQVNSLLSRVRPKRVPKGSMGPNPIGSPEHRRYGYADGGIHPAKIYNQSAGIRVFNEPETGGEAYIPMGAAKRGQALPVLSEVARRFGYQLNQYANGGFWGTRGSGMVGGGAYGTPAGRELVVVPVPVQSKQVTNFNGDIQGVKLEDAERYAARKRRQQRLTRS